MTGNNITTAPASSQAGSGDDAQRQRRARKSRPKVKTGCSNCKQRRIKCDEKRPSCSQCLKSRKVCTGYPPPPRAKIHEEVRIAPRPIATSSTISPISPANTITRIAWPPTDVLHLVRQPSRPSVPAARRMTPPQTPLSKSLTTYHLSANLPLDPQEGLYFQLFRERTASELSGFFDSSFWTRSVLQECHTEEAIRHSVVALGALYKTLEKMTESPPSSPSETYDPSDLAVRHWEVAFRHYDLALKAMVSIAPQDQSSQRTSLMANVLLACFDSFIGDHKQAIVQIQNGLRLLQKLRSERRRQFMPTPEEPVEKDLIQMFTRLAVQAKSYDMAFHFPQPYVIQLTPQDTSPVSPPSDDGSPISTDQQPIPITFESLLEARLAWDALCEKMLRFTETMFHYTNSTSPMGVLPTSLKQFGLGFKDDIEAWSNAFEKILSSRKAPGKGSQETTAIAVLKMFQIMGQILFLMTFSASELQFDSFLPQFQAIVELAMEVVGDEERRAAAERCPDPRFCQHRPNASDIFGGHEYTARHIKPSFSADMGIVPPLFVVATKCRDPVTRRQAIQLLRSSARREGMWDSELSARIAMFITGIEEEETVAGNTRRPSVSMNQYTTDSPSSRYSSAMDFGHETPLGPGGNARPWSRRGTLSIGSPDREQKPVIPEEKRVMVRAVEFDLRERTATLQCGTRNLIPGMSDQKTRVTKIVW